MINWLIGASGGGKSYEAVRYQILPALERGRHVITNLPVNIEEFEKLNPDYGKLLHLRKVAQPILGKFIVIENTPVFDLFNDGFKQEPPRNQRVFAGVWDFYFTDEYRTETGQGPLFVIDECHFSFPYKNTNIDVEDWFSTHRHYNADCLLITQSYGKVSQSIRDNTQIVYRVRKNIAFGSKDSYVKKVQDGFRGDVVNTSIRQYDAKYFPLYRSHTQGNSVEEFGAEDITPLWMRWPFIGTALAAVILIIMISTMEFKNPLNANSHVKNEQPSKDLSTLHADLAIDVPAKAPDPKPVEQSTKTTTETISPQELKSNHPLLGKGLHILARVHGTFNGQYRDVWRFTVSQNAQKAFEINLEELLAMGYEFKPMNDCVASITYGEFKKIISCDAPVQQVTMGGTST